MSFIADPTAVLIEYLRREQAIEPRNEFLLGRLAMCLEILTVIKTLEDETVPMLTLQRMEIISVLQTLLVEQGMEDTASRWYEALNQWRQPSFVREPSPAGTDLSWLVETADVYGPASLREEPEDEVAPGPNIPALPRERQSQGLSLDESDPQPPEEEPATRIAGYESPDDSAEDLAEFLRQSRSRRETE